MRKLLFLTILLGSFAGIFAEDHDDQANNWGDKGSVRHVLLISIDGMHAIDFKNCSQGIAGANDGKPYCPNLAGSGHERRELCRGQHLEAIGLVSGTDEHRQRCDAAPDGRLLRRGV